MPGGDGDTPADRLRALLEQVVEAFGVEAEVEVVDDEEALRGVLLGDDDLGLVIGRHGQTIDALEHLAARVAYRGEPQPKRVVVDAAGYRDRRSEMLVRQADRAAAEAVRYGRAVALDAMVATERRLVHEHLRDRPEIETYSEGDEPNRQLVVAPAASAGEPAVSRLT